MVRHLVEEAERERGSGGPKGRVGDGRLGAMVRGGESGLRTPEWLRGIRGDGERARPECGWEFGAGRGLAERGEGKSACEQRCRTQEQRQEGEDGDEGVGRRHVWVIYGHTDGLQAVF